MAAFLSALLALMRALPAVESLVRQAITLRDQEREREATGRLAAKDAAVAAAIDGPPKAQ